MYLEISNVVLLVILWILLQPGALFTFNISDRSIKLTWEHFFEEVAPHLLLLVIVWAFLSKLLSMWHRRETTASDDESILREEQQSSDGPGAMGPG